MSGINLYRDDLRAILRLIEAVERTEEANGPTAVLRHPVGLTRGEDADANLGVLRCADGLWHWASE